MSDQIYTATDLLKAADVLRHIGANLAIEFQLNFGDWSKQKAMENIKKREALLDARQILCDQHEHIASMR